MQEDKIKLTATIKVCYDTLEAAAARFPRTIARKTLATMFLAMLDEEITMIQSDPVGATIALNELGNIKEIVDKIVDNAPAILLKVKEKKKNEKKVS